ncbi:DUF4145 domain-containing protein [Acinetobacter sp. Tol 5]|uniref:DUF4145 domain-containing protein n=1 Tax=Acinetobacter sp. (strain Tol 5) TaxID=710648 RepID=UPI001C74B554|nr:DUF4145 domain-containing protein [Acinetobacter sp. Tol 5]BCX73988.1 hypothetical protein TOL5_21880 [Acinetobacter sp. Tol 5]
MTENSKIKTQCIDCKRETNHLIVATKMYHFKEHRYRYGKEYSIVQCLGCDHVSFLQIYHDYEISYPVEEIWTSEGYDYRYDYDKGFTNFYPDTKDVFRKLEKILPEKLFEIYSETKNAYIQNLDIFTAIGIRSIIECICNDNKIEGRNLENKITNLKKFGNLSKVDIEMLHSLRFIGNDAVHELNKSTKSELTVAFKIVDNLIDKIYIMPKDLANTNFKKYLADYDDFENYIKEKLEALDSSQIYTIKGLIDENIKISNDFLSEYEKKLNDNIKLKHITWLEVVNPSKLADGENNKDLFYRKI